MKQPGQLPPPKAKPNLKLTREQLAAEMRRNINEYADDLRELIRKLRGVRLH